jgi:hypothetical protein
MDRFFEESDQLAEELLAVVDDLQLVNDTERVQMSDVACSLSIEHWHSVRALLQSALLPSALVVHRAQYESITRSVWLAYAATDENVAKFTAELNLDSEQAAKNSPSVEKMLQQIEVKAPRSAFEALARFREHNWKALNSYAHAGIHPLRRHQEGYPVILLHGVLCNTNGLAVMSFMQAAVLGGEQPLQQQILDIAARHAGCMPPPL